VPHDDDVVLDTKEDAIVRSTFRSLTARTVAVLAALLVAGAAAAVPASANNAPQPPGPVPTKTVTQTQQVLVAQQLVPTIYGSHEACGRAWPGYYYSGPWTAYTCTENGPYNWRLRLQQYTTKTVTVQVPMVWRVVTTHIQASYTSGEQCGRTGASTVASSGGTWNGYTCPYAYQDMWGNVYYNLVLSKSAWT